MLPHLHFCIVDSQLMQLSLQILQRMTMIHRFLVIESHELYASCYKKSKKIVNTFKFTFKERKA